MKLSNIINNLAVGELSAHGMFADYPTIDLNQLNKDRLVRAINDGLIALYTRFPLLTKELVLNQYSWITEYRLSSLYSVTNTDSTETKYIIDSLYDPFIDDVLRVEAIHDECNVKLHLNNTTDCRVALTPAMDVIQVPNPVQDMKLFVTYRARHPKVEKDDDPILLPTHFMSPLCMYVAHKIYSGASSQDQLALAQTILQQYENVCNEYYSLGVVNDDDGENHQMFNNGGWV